MKKVILILIIALAMLFAAMGAAIAAPGAVAIGSMLTVADPLSDFMGQGNKAAALDDERYVVISVEPSGRGYAIFGQIFNLDDDRIRRFQCNTGIITDRLSPKPVVAAIGDYFVVAWLLESSASPGSYAVVYQVFGLNGDKKGPETAALSPHTDNIDKINQGRPAIAKVKEDYFMLAWCEKSTIWGIILAPDGNPATDYFQVSKEGQASEYRPPVAASLSGGDVVVVWAYNSGRGYTGLASVLDSMGRSTSGIKKIDYMDNTCIAALAYGGFVLAGDSGGDIAGRIYDGSADPAGSMFPVNKYDDGFQSYSQVAGLASGGFVVTWRSVEGAHTSDKVFIRGQAFGPDGAMEGEDLRISDPSDPDAAPHNNGVIGVGGKTFVPIWAAAGASYSGYRMYAQIWRLD